MHTYDIEFSLQIDDLKTVEVSDSLVSVMRLLDRWIATDKWWDCCVLRLIRRSSNQRVLSGADSNGCRPARWCHLRYCHALSGTGIFEVSCGPVLDTDTRVCLSVCLCRDRDTSCVSGGQKESVANESMDERFTYCEMSPSGRCIKSTGVWLLRAGLLHNLWTLCQVRSNSY